ncbi:unnamed protein product [Symbiodinium sp. CCMP2592]|nr:unnamed protein product [Symbiodinium sp. CCMP2592]
MQHEANTNFVLTLHLVLQLGRDGQYSAEVGEQHATLTQGGILVFDPTFVHTVQNSSEAEMYLFYCHFYHPQITEVERYALLFLTQLMERLQTTGLVKSSSLAPAPAVDASLRQKGVARKQSFALKQVFSLEHDMQQSPAENWQLKERWCRLHTRKTDIQLQAWLARHPGPRLLLRDPQFYESSITNVPIQYDSAVSYDSPLFHTYSTVHRSCSGTTGAVGSRPPSCPGLQGIEVRSLMCLLSEDVAGVRANRSFMRGFTGGCLRCELGPLMDTAVFGVLAVREELSFLGCGWERGMRRCAMGKRSLQCGCGAVGVVVKTGQVAP